MARTYPTTVTANSIASSSKFNDETVLQLQHLLGFTLDGVDLNTITSPLELHDFTERVAPTTPSSGKMAMYVDSADGQLKTKNDAGRISYIGEGLISHKVVLGTDSTTWLITFTDYEGFTGTSAMRIIYHLRGTTTTGLIVVCNARWNDETSTANYYRQRAGKQDTSDISGDGNDQVALVMPTANSPSGNYTQGSFFIHDISSGSKHNIISQYTVRYDTGAAMIMDTIGITWENTAAITSMRLVPALGSILAGSWVKLMFIKEVGV